MWLVFILLVGAGAVRIQEHVTARESPWMVGPVPGKAYDVITAENAETVVLDFEERHELDDGGAARGINVCEKIKGCHTFKAGKNGEPPPHFKCKNGRRIPAHFINDGMNDCGDLSDETSVADAHRPEATRAKEWYLYHFGLLKTPGVVPEKLDADLDDRINKYYGEAWIEGFPRLAPSKRERRIDLVFLTHNPNSAYMQEYSKAVKAGGFEADMTKDKDEKVDSFKHVGLGFIIRDKETGEEISRMDFQMTQGLWGKNYAPLDLDHQLEVSAKTGLPKWKGCMLLSLVSKGKGRWVHDWQFATKLATLDEALHDRVLNDLELFARNHLRFAWNAVVTEEGRVVLPSTACSAMMAFLQRDLKADFSHDYFSHLFPRETVWVPRKDVRIVDIEKDQGAKEEILEIYQKMQSYIKAGAEVEAEKDRKAKLSLVDDLGRAKQAPLMQGDEQLSVYQQAGQMYEQRYLIDKVCAPRELSGVPTNNTEAPVKFALPVTNLPDGTLAPGDPFSPTKYVIMHYIGVVYPSKFSKPEDQDRLAYKIPCGDGKDFKVAMQSFFKNHKEQL